jgi:GTP cyclohydrolase I
MKKPSVEKGSKIITQLMEWLNIPIKDSTKETPERVAKMYLELFSGLYESLPKIKIFKEKKAANSYVCISNIQFSSVCDHHLIPFIGKCSIVYVVNDSGDVIGLSKLIRIVKHWASRPQLQERLNSEIAEDIMNRISPKGVYVTMSATHLCISLRGVKDVNAKTNTEVVVGNIDKKEAIKLLGDNYDYGRN